MLVLVLGANLPVTFVGWEGVGLCSYLLIGFWFSDQANADAGKKAFIVNRIGDFGFLMAMFMLFANVGTLDYTGIAAAAPTLPSGGPVVTCDLSVPAAGMRGQERADSALRLAARCDGRPDAGIGADPRGHDGHRGRVSRGANVDAVRDRAGGGPDGLRDRRASRRCSRRRSASSSGTSRRCWRIRRSRSSGTCSSAVGAGAYAAGIFHLVTHAFFKALLFLGAGSVIYAMHAAYHETHSHEDAQDMRNMGGLRTKLPVTWALMWIATLAIAGIPLFAGFFSKDEILGTVFERAQGSTLGEATWLGHPWEHRALRRLWHVARWPRSSRRST